MRNYYSNEDVLAAIEQRAFCAGYEQRMIEKMYAEGAAEGAAEGEKLLDRLKEYGKKAKETVWGSEGGWKKNWGRRAATIAVPVAAAAGGTALYLHNKKKKAQAAAEALEEAAEAQRAYSEYLEERIYNEIEEEEVKPSKKHLVIGAGIGAGATALGLGSVAGASALRKKGYEKAKQALSEATLASIAGKEGAAELKAAAEKKINKYGIDYLDKNLLERGKKYWNNAGKLGKAGIIGGGAAGLAAGAGIGTGAAAALKKYKDYKAAKAIEALEDAED